jgi:hypothetical protein
MHKIYIDRVLKEAPSAWHELTADQLIIWMKICAKDIGIEKALMFASSVFLGLPKREYFKLNAAQQIQLADQFKYLLDNKLFAWLIPVIKVGLLGKFHGPKDHLHTSTIEEFNAAESYFHEYQRTGKEAFLDMLIAVLYRPISKHNNGKDERKNFTEIDVIRNAPRMRKLDKHLRAAILFNFEGCRRHVVSWYPTIFIPGKEGEKSKFTNLTPLIKTVAGGTGKFGSFRETEQTNLYLFLDHLRDEIEESNRK